MSAADLTLWLAIIIEFGKLVVLTWVAYSMVKNPELVKWFLRSVWQVISKVPNWFLSPVMVDGTLYVCIAMFLAIQSYFTTEEAYKYVNAYAIFWIKGICATLGAGAGALKMFRSRTYSDHMDALNPSLQPPSGEASLPTKEPKP